jgi:hypothetical protein
MKSFITAMMVMFATTSFAAEPVKKDAAPTEVTNCVKKDKNGKCPPPPKSPKPTPKKVEQK